MFLMITPTKWSIAKKIEKHAFSINKHGFVKICCHILLRIYIQLHLHAKYFTHGIIQMSVKDM